MKGRGWTRPRSSGPCRSGWKQANHNAFNQILGPDMLAFTDRPDCAELLAPDDQRQFLTDIGSRLPDDNL